LPDHAKSQVGRGLTDHPTSTEINTFAMNIDNVPLPKTSHAKIIFYSRGLRDGNEVRYGDEPQSRVLAPAGQRPERTRCRRLLDEHQRQTSADALPAGRRACRSGRICEPGDRFCRPRQRQALLQWAYDSRTM
jgi:hypothetical protein